MKFIRCTPLETAAEAVCDQNSICPLIFQLPPEQGRRLLETAQETPVRLYPATVSSIRIRTGKWGEIPLWFIAPPSMESIRRVLFYIHGAGWVFGSYHTHQKLVRELAYRTGSLVVFPEYFRSPEARYPVAIEQCYDILSRLSRILEKQFPGLSPESLDVAGDSVGGNMAIAMCLLSQERKGPSIRKLLLYYPVTDAYFDTPSYRQYAKGYYLYRAGMQWFWDQYAPCPADRRHPTASPLRADTECLSGFPKTLIINGQADVLRSEGEAFAQKLLCAGADVTAVQIQATIHDFVMLNALNQTNACRIAMDISTGWLTANDRETAFK